MYVYKVYFNKVKETIEANYHLYCDGFLKFFKLTDPAMAELVAEFDEAKITGWQREGTKKDKPKLGFVQLGGKSDDEKT